MIVTVALSAGTDLALPGQAVPRASSAPARMLDLFDGHDLSQWRGLHGSLIQDQIWQIRDGLLCVQPNRRSGDDIISIRSFDNFDLRFQWRIAPGGNSGVKYLIHEELTDPTRVRLHYGSLWVSIALAFVTLAFVLLVRDHRFSSRRPLFGILLGVTLFLCLFAAGVSVFQSGQGTSAVGLEFQLFDAPGEPPSTTRTSGALYDLFAPSVDATKPAGEFNEGRVLVRGTHIEHWVNGTRVLEVDLDSEEFRTALQYSKFSGLAFDLKHPGPISLQNHMDGACFRAVQISEIPTGR